MKRVVCDSNISSAHKSLDEMQIRIGYLQNVKDKLEAKLNADNQHKVAEAVSFFINEIDECIGTYAKTIYDSTL